MSAVTCPDGHPTVSLDYCDVCGAPVGAPDVGASTPAGTPPAAGAGDVVCSNCALANAPGALFCEGCGFDFTTGALPRTAAVPDVNVAAPDPVLPGGGSIAPTVPVEWVAEVWVDPTWYAEQDCSDPCPSAGLPVIVPLSVKSLLVGRASKSRGIAPDIECDGDDAVSRRHAQLSTDGTRWFVEDLSSSNGTFVGTGSGSLPTTPLPPGQRRELGADDRVYVGAWTRIVVRRATDQELAGA